jgi:cyclic beta-1,2-glucan synthetase
MATPNQCAADMSQVPVLLSVPQVETADSKSERPARSQNVRAGLQPQLDAEQEQILSAARAEVRSWTVTDAAEALPILETKWKAADQSIRMASARLRDVPRLNAMDLRLFSENVTLFQTALNETQDAIVTARKLPQVQITDSERVPRAFAAGESFLRVVNYGISKDALVTFLKGAQERLPFQMAELWDLKPLMELALLEQIGETAKACVPEQSSADDSLPPGAPPKPAETAIGELTSCLKRILELDWEEIFEEVSVTEQILRRDPVQAYECMDSESRGTYRVAVVDLAAHSPLSEQEIANKAVQLAGASHSEPSARARERRSHIGYYLLGEGESELKEAIEYQAPIAERAREFVLRHPTSFYYTGIVLLTLAVMALFAAIPGVRALRWYEVALFFLPALECGVATMNLLTTMLVPPRKLPRLDFSEGIPVQDTTLVVIPMLLGSEEQAKQAARDLEVRYLGNRDANLHFALLTDPPDSVKQFDEKDELAKFCSGLIAELNQKYAADGKGTFFHFHRDRTYNSSEQTWMGWERKRGKLLNLNNLLLGKSVDFSTVLGDVSVLPTVRYVITLDLDTQLPRESAHKMIGALAHPLNRGVIDPEKNVVVEGHGILQPRVGISVKSKNKSRLAEIFSGDAGLDPYTLATSDVYQDLFGEGIFTGKGIYEVETFQQVLDLRFPCNAVLSHDLLEGSYTRAGLLSDVEVIDDYPSHVSAYSRRKHRWVRGDWQIIRWLLPEVPDRAGNMVLNPLNSISRWKIVDNIRRSLTEFGFFVLLLCGWMVLPGRALYWTLATVVAISLPVYISFVVSVIKAARLPGFAVHWDNIFSDFANTQLALVTRVALLLHQSLVTLDAIVRTLVRMTVTRKRLLQWETAADAESATKKTPVEICLNWTPWICFVIDLVVVVVRPSSILIALPFLALWGCSKTVCDWLNRPYWTSGNKINEKDRVMLRSVSLRTWRFYRELSNQQENWLIPDIIHENNTLAAHQISPTNLGFLLNSRLAALDLGWSTLSEFAGDIEKTFGTIDRMPKRDGSFYNWYNTLTLEPLKPRFISTVDNGNLVCCLWTLKQGCLEAAREPVFRTVFLQGLGDHLETTLDLLPRDGAPEGAVISIERLKQKIKSCTSAENWLDGLPGIAADAAALDQQLSATSVSDEARWWAHELSLRIAALQQMVTDFAPWLAPAYTQFRQHFAEQLKLKIGRLTLADLNNLQNSIASRAREVFDHEDTGRRTRLAMESLLSALARATEITTGLFSRLNNIAADSERIVRGMDFAFLYNPEQRQVSIGFDVEQQVLHVSHYDLLSSEARAAVFVAIAKGAVPQASWFNLGRPRKTYKKAGVLLSWTGTMFEYLLPSLWMKSYPNSLLEESSQTAVRLQQNYAAARSVPWGISESSCSERNPDNHYRYHAFGLPSLAISQSDRDELVISPYSAFLALLVDAQNAAKNIREMKSRGWVGTYGFYDAADFTPSRLPAGKSCEEVTCWMAHHQGMILVAAATFLGDMSMQRRFHAEPMVAATERLLQEKIPRTPVLELELPEREAPVQLAPPPSSPTQQALQPAG